MGLFFRKSKDFGFGKLNFSNSGIGFSTGIKGLRFGIDSKGRQYISGGKGPFRFREYIKDDNTQTNENDLSGYVLNNLPYMLKNNSILFLAKFLFWVIWFPLFFIGGVFCLFNKQISEGLICLGIFYIGLHYLYFSKIAKARRYCLHSIKLLKENNVETAIKALKMAKETYKNAHYQECLENIIKNMK